MTHLKKRFEGTYIDKNQPSLPWNDLISCDFNHPHWNALYPVNSKGAPTGIIPPRLACKLFRDGLSILARSSTSDKCMQDRIPECTHKSFKKKQWREQYYEGCRRVICRLARGLGFAANCVAEELFVHVLLRCCISGEYGWSRLNDELESVLVTEKDQDFVRVVRMASNEEVGLLYHRDSDGADSSEAKPSSSKSKGGAAATPVVSADLKTWFNPFNCDPASMTDHLITPIAEDFSAAVTV